jgi:hypothetical protein
MGQSVTLLLADLTDHRTFRRTIVTAQVDTTSAEWIVEAPSVCSSANLCQTLALADFGTARISAARAVTANGRSGAISSPWWSTTSIVLAPNARRFIGYGGSNSGGGGHRLSAVGERDVVCRTLRPTGRAVLVGQSGSARRLTAHALVHRSGTLH